VPAGTPDGGYDLLTALYYDVDGDGAVGGADLALVLRNDPGAVTVSSLPSISAGVVTAREGHRTASTVTVTLTLSEPASGEVSVDWATRDGTATAGLDYLPASGRVTISAGDTSGAIAITVLGDYLVEGDEELFVDLSNPSGATLASSSATVTIADDDASPCDADASGSENAVDLAVMLRVLTDPSYEPPGNPDCNQDGALDGADVGSLLAGL
jgi:chitinase